MRYFLLLLGVMSSLASANVVITGTRVVYPSEKKEVNIQLENVGTNPALVQVWVDNGSKTALDKQAIPFMLTPPVFRMDAKKRQTLRLIYTQEPLATDRETLFYFNLLDIPPKPVGKDAPENYLQISLSSRLKLFFRPKGLSVSVADAPSKLRIQKQSGSLKIENPTPYYLTLSKIHLKQNSQDKQATTLSDDLPMIAPFSQVNVPFSDKGNFSHIIVDTINDYGGITSTEQPLK